MPGHYGAVGLELVLSQYLQLVEERSALQAAIVFLPMAIAGFIAGPLAGRVMHRMRPAALAGGAFVLAAVCVLALALTRPDATHYPVIRLVLLVGMGLGIGASVTFASSTIMNAAPPERGGIGGIHRGSGLRTGQFAGRGGVWQRDDSRLCHVAGIA